MRYSLIPDKIGSMKNPEKTHWMFSWTPFLFLLFLFALFVAQLFYPKSKLETSIRYVQLWPQLPASHFALARSLTENGYEELAQKEFLKGESLTKNLKYVLLGWLFKRDLEETKKMVFQKEALTNKLNEVNELLSSYPYSWQLLLKKSVLDYQLYQDGQASAAADLAFWLDPGNKTVIKLKKDLKL